MEKFNFLKNGLETIEEENILKNETLEGQIYVQVMRYEEVKEQYEYEDLEKALLMYEAQRDMINIDSRIQRHTTVRCFKLSKTRYYAFKSMTHDLAMI